MVESMTNQQIFNKVAKHLIEQNRKSFYGSCKYKYGSLKCAIGCLIPDNVYNKKFEGLTVRKLFAFEKERMKECGLTWRNIKLLDGLQDIHDQYEVESWSEELKDTAREFRLKHSFIK